MAPKGDMPRERSRSPSIEARQLVLRTILMARIEARQSSSSAPRTPIATEPVSIEGGFGVFTVPDDLTAAKDKAFMDLRKAIKASTAAAKASASEVQAKLEAYQKAKARAAAAAAAAANANVSFPMTQQALEELLDIDSEAEPDPPQ